MIKSKALYSLASILLLIIIWQILTLFFPPLIVPSFGAIIASLVKILSNPSMYQMIALTLMRLIIGLGVGLLIGMVVGILMGFSKVFTNIFRPYISLCQTIPPVAWLVLALVWFGINSKPAIFIVIISTIPVVAINIAQGIKSIDPKLLEMADIYQFSKKKKYKDIILPSIKPFFNSALAIVLGGGWKVAVMGEVLTVNDGIGGMIKDARLNVEPEMIIAWSLIIVLLFNLSNLIIKIIFKEQGEKHVRN